MILPGPTGQRAGVGQTRASHCTHYEGLRDQRPSGVTSERDGELLLAKDLFSNKHYAMHKRNDC